MTQITATLSDNANPSIIREVLENMKGVLKVTISKHQDVVTEKCGKTMERLDKLANLQKKLDLSSIDIKDERTRYILRGSKLLSELEGKQK